MSQSLTKEEIQKRADAIEAIYEAYLVELNNLKQEQSEIINKFMKKLEQKKIDAIRKTLSI